MQSLPNIIDFCVSCTNKPIDRVYIRCFVRNTEGRETLQTTISLVPYYQNHKHNLAIKELLFILFNKPSLKSIKTMGTEKLTVKIDISDDKEINGEELILSLKQFERACSIEITLNAFSIGEEDHEPISVNPIATNIDKLKELMNGSLKLCSGLHIYISEGKTSVDIPFVVKE